VVLMLPVNAPVLPAIAPWNVTGPEIVATFGNTTFPLS
jgi:hypothetical protein